MNIRLLQKKLKSVNNIKKITHAMQLVSAVKMKKAHQAYLSSLPYYHTLQQSLHKITQKIDASKSPLLAGRERAKELVIVLTSNKGLCGSFNYNLLRYLAKHTDANSEVITIGKKGASFVSKLGYPRVADFSHIPLTHTSAIFTLALKSFLEGTYSHVSVVYNKFISAFLSAPIKELLLPITIEELREDEASKSKEYLIEPNPEEALDAVLKSYVEAKLRFAILSNEAGEHAARMMAMKNATDNAVDLISQLTLSRNKVRQQRITYELLDITTAKASVEA